MTRENHEAFIKMALEAGFESVTVVQNGFADPTKQEIFANGNEVNLTKFAQLVAAHERDACAQIADAAAARAYTWGRKADALDISSAIRART